ncbi:MAG: hypothetical protein RLP44_06035 [Aggregatilineales bacterium]
MGIRFDWEIEAEQNTFVAGEDPAAAKRRRGLRFRLLLMVALVFMIIGAIVVLIATRADQIQQEEENTLRATVDAEVAALRIGNRSEFLSVQRSATDVWLQTQDRTFDAYQQLKLESDIRLTGQVQDIEISERRGRVKVEEVIDGVPYQRMWFYWRYDPVLNDQGVEIEPGGWFHVPPDYTFWGDTQLYEGEQVRISYREVDSALAQSMGAQLESWLTTACNALTCSEVPTLAVSIEVDDALSLRWAEENEWQLRLPSPYINRARTDMPFSPELRIEIAALLAERLVNTTTNNLQIQFASDADFLRQSVVSWLVGQFVQVNPETYLIASLATQYGAPVIGQMLTALAPESSIAILSTATGVESLAQLSVDWRDFLTWRLTLENQLIRAGDIDSLLRWYDVRDEAINTLVYDRYNQNIVIENPLVLLVQDAGVGADGSPQLLATVQSGAEGATTQQEVTFRLIDNVWKRIN